MSTATSRTTRGVVYIHSAPSSLCPHITWALESALGQQVQLDWLPQPAGPRLMRAELSWSGDAGLGSRLASSLRGWDHLRYEVTEEPSPGVDGSRWSHTPSLGIHHTWVSASGDAVVHENRLREALRATGRPQGPGRCTGRRPRSRVGPRAGAVPLRRGRRTRPLAAQRGVAACARWAGSTPYPCLRRAGVARVKQHDSASSDLTQGAPESSGATRRRAVRCGR